MHQQRVRLASYFEGMKGLSETPPGIRPQVEKPKRVAQLESAVYQRERFRILMRAGEAKRNPRRGNGMVDGGGEEETWQKVKSEESSAAIRRAKPVA